MEENNCFIIPCCNSQIFNIILASKMDNIDGSKTSHSDSLEVSQTMKAASAPICLSEVPNNETQLTTQVSAPSYLFSLKENESPPFKKPGKEAKPILLIGTIMNEQEAIQMVAAADANKENGLKKWLSKSLDTCRLQTLLLIDVCLIIH